MNQESIREPAEELNNFFWICDLRTNRLTYVSPGYEQIWGRSLESLYEAPRSWFDAVCQEDRERIFKALGKQIREGFNEEYRIVRPDGTVRWIWERVVPVRDAFGEASYLAGHAEDFSDQKRKSEEFRKRYEFMISILDQLRTGIILVDPSGVIQFINQYCGGLFGWRPAGVVGMNWEKVCPFAARDVARLKKVIQLPPQARETVWITIEQKKNGTSNICVEIQDCPSDTGCKIFYFSDIREKYRFEPAFDSEEPFHDIIGRSPGIRRVREQVHEVSQVDWTVLITGETGTGKEMVARAVHYSSRRKDGPLIAINCAGLSETLLLSQLFGHKRGAFTGAASDQKGLIEAANGGTLFLDEIGDIPLSVQTNLLRFLETKEIIRLGEVHSRKLDVRIIVATHRQLEEEVSRGRFRADLLYRIRVMRIELQPLRERTADIPYLVRWFLRQHGHPAGKGVPDITHRAMRALMAYPWPGNVRELKNCVDFAVVRSRGLFIQPEDLPPEVNRDFLRMRPQRGDSRQMKERIRAALEEARGNRKVAARLLGISRATFYRRLAELRTPPS